MNYGLPSPSVVENWLFQQEDYLIEAIAKKARPRSKRTEGFSFLQMDAEWIARFWRVYVHCPREGNKPVLFLAMNHFHSLKEFSNHTILRCEAEKAAETLRAELNKQNYERPSLVEYREFTLYVPPYHGRRKLREEFSPFTFSG